jgi:hypothetical protein
VGFVVDKVALGQVFSEYFGFPCQSSFHQYASSGRSTQRPTPPIKKKLWVLFELLSFFL